MNTVKQDDLKEAPPEGEVEDESGGAGSSYDFAFQPNTHAKNVSCRKKVEVSMVGGIKYENGRRDKCKSGGSGCTPTRCL